MQWKIQAGLQSLAECPGANLGDLGWDTSIAIGADGEGSL
jgi:hypothetical protein